MTTRTVRDLAWLAGLLEGEGSFMDSKGSPCISVQLTDFDVLDRAAGIMGISAQASVVTPRGKATYKPVRALRVHGTNAVSWMMTLYTFLGERRRAKVREIIARWRASDRTPRGPRGQRFMATCHPDRIRAGHGLCDKCYMAQWRQRRKEGAVNVSMKDFGASILTLA